jgi:hypothetical protein
MSIDISSYHHIIDIIIAMRQQTPPAKDGRVSRRHHYQPNRHPSTPEARNPNKISQKPRVACCDIIFLFFHLSILPHNFWFVNGVYQQRDHHLLHFQFLSRYGLSGWAYMEFRLLASELVAAVLFFF